MIYYTIIVFNEVDIRIYLPEKVIIRQDRKANLYITFKLKLTKLFYISPQQNLYPLFCYVTFHLRMKILLLSLLLLKTCSTFNLRHLSLRTLSQVLATVIKIF